MKYFVEEARIPTGRKRDEEGQLMVVEAIKYNIPALLQPAKAASSPVAAWLLECFGLLPTAIAEFAGLSS